MFLLFYYFYPLIITVDICIQICYQIDGSLGPAVGELAFETIFLHVKLLSLSL